MMPVRWISHTLQDFRYALRQYKRKPGFALLAVLTLAFGIGATTAIYTLIYAVLLRPLPYSQAVSLVMVWDNAPTDGDRFKAIMPSREDFEEYAKSSHTLDLFSSSGRIRPVLHFGGLTRRTLGGLVTTAMFRETLGSMAQLGRVFIDGDRQVGCVVILAHGFWARVLGADAKLVGKSLTFDETPCTVVGVMPVGFDLFPIQADVWFLRDHAPRESVESARRGGFLDTGIIYARLKPRFSPAQAETELTALHRSLHAADPAGEKRGERGRVAAVVGVRSAITSVTSPSLDASLRLAFGAVVLLLLIACVNVANLLLARVTDRQRELAVRAALGSGRARLVRQLFAEGFFLAAGGTALGVGLAWAGVWWFRHLNPFELPTQAGEVTVSPSILLFAVGLSAPTTVLFTMLPAIAGSSIDLSQSLRAGGHGFFGAARRRWSAQVLIAVEVALSFVLLAAAGLLMTSALRLEREPLGFDVAGIATASAGMPAGRYSMRESREAFERTLRQRLQGLPGVTSVTYGTFPPDKDGGESQVEIQGRPVQAIFDVDFRPGSREYLEMLRVPVVRGRTFDDADRTGPAVAIVSQRFVDEYLNGADPIGKSIRVVEGGVRGEWRTIVGVVGTWKHIVSDTVWRETPVVFAAGGNTPEIGAQYGFIVGVRAKGDLAALPREIQYQIAAIEPNAVLQDTEILSDRLWKMLAYPRFRALLLVVFGAGALLLAAVGIYGVVAQLVSQRLPELGLRRAVGARGADLAWLVARQAGSATVVGLVFGVVTTLAAGKVVQGMLYGLEPEDPVIFSAAGLVSIVTAILAMALPARSAALVDPITALRQE